MSINLFDKSHKWSALKLALEQERKYKHEILNKYLYMKNK